MAGSIPWKRVNPAAKCPVCGHDSWCTIMRDGSVSHCMRVSSDHACAGGGWIHTHGGDSAPRAKAIAAKASSASASSRLSHKDCVSILEPMGAVKAPPKGVRADALNMMGARQNHAGDIYCPMWDFDAAGIVSMCGVRIRRVSGRKLAVKGSRNGVFAARDNEVRRGEGGYITIVEGMTDTAAAIGAGFSGVIGRPSCSGGAIIIVRIVAAVAPQFVKIIADRDPAGVDGAYRLARMLMPCPVGIIVPRRHKDLREFVADGGTRETLNTM